MAEDVHDNAVPEGVAEAAAIFARTRAKLSPHLVFKEAQEASAKLLQDLAQAARAAGYEAGPEHGALVISLRTQGAVYVVADDNAMPIKVLVGVHGSKDPAAEAKVEFDPFLRRYVGTDEDDSRAPKPGERRARHSAVEVIAEMAVTMIERQALSRRGGR